MDLTFIKKFISLIKIYKAKEAVAKPLTNKKSVQNCFLFICR